MRGRLIDQVWQYNPTMNAPARYRRACRYQAFLPDPVANLEFTMSATAAGLVADAEAAIRELTAVARPVLQPLARLLLRTESIASSKVEGMQMSAREVAHAEAKIETGARVGSTALEVVGNIEAMELAIEDATRAQDFGAREIAAIHERLMSRTPGANNAGRVRETQNWIGGNDHNPCGADFVPPPPEYVDELLADVCHAIGEETLPALIQAAIVHAQFETIHPFDDGNGRTGRALIHVVLRRRDVAPAYVPPISLMFAERRDGYIAGLTAYRDGDIESWIERFADAAASSARLAAGYVVAVQELMMQWKAQLEESGVRSHAAAHAIIDVLPGYPIITTQLAAAATGRARSAIHKGIEMLQETGVLLALTTTKRNRSWEAKGLLDLLTRLEAGELRY